MSMIIAGRFAHKTQADGAIQALRSGGISPDHILKADNMSGMFNSKPASNEGSPSGRESSPEDTTIVRPAGFLVAISTRVDTERTFAAGVLREHGARDVEETDRIWRDGEWIELNLVSEPPPPAAKSFW